MRMGQRATWTTLRCKRSERSRAATKVAISVGSRGGYGVVPVVKMASPREPMTR